MLLLFVIVVNGFDSTGDIKMIDIIGTVSFMHRHISRSMAGRQTSWLWGTDECTVWIGIALSTENPNINDIVA